MKVKEVMTPNPSACTPTSTLADAAGLMWDNDCGIVPVVKEGGKVVGLVTDRDICMAAQINNRNLSNIAVEEVISGEVFACGPDDDVRTALKTMAQNKVHRLPVVAADGSLEGVLSMNDLVLKAEDSREKKAPELSYADVIKAYKGICEHRLPAQQARSAAGV